MKPFKDFLWWIVVLKKTTSFSSTKLLHKHYGKSYRTKMSLFTLKFKHKLSSSIFLLTVNYLAANIVSVEKSEDHSKLVYVFLKCWVTSFLLHEESRQYNYLETDSLELSPFLKNRRLMDGWVNGLCALKLMLALTDHIDAFLQDNFVPITVVI